MKRDKANWEQRGPLEFHSPQEGLNEYTSSHGQAGRTLPTHANENKVLASPYFAPLLSLTLLIVGGLIGINILGHQAPQNITFATKCDGIVSPRALSIKLYDYRNISLHNFAGQASFIAQGSRFQSGKSKSMPFDSTLSFDRLRGPSSDETPAIKIRAGQVLGTGAILAAPGAVLAAVNCQIDSTKCISLQSQSPSSLTVQAASEEMKLTANRVTETLSATGGGIQDNDQASFVLTNPLALVRAAFQNLAATPASPAEVLVDFKDEIDSSPDISFPSSPTSVRREGIAVRAQEFTYKFINCSDPEMQRDGNAISTIMHSHPMDVYVTGDSSFEISSIKLQFDPSKPGLSNLSVLAHGRANSVLQAGQQLLPTTLDEILNGDQKGKGMFGLCAAFILFGAGILAKHSFETIFKLLIPGQGGQREVK